MLVVGSPGGGVAGRVSGGSVRLAGWCHLQASAQRRSGPSALRREGGGERWDQHGCDGEGLEHAGRPPQTLTGVSYPAQWLAHTRGPPIGYWR